MKKSAKKNHSISNEKPQGLCQAFFQLLWPLNSLRKKVIFAFIVFFISVFLVWNSLPEGTKTEFIAFLARIDSSATIQNNAKIEEAVSQEKQHTQRPSRQGIHQPSIVKEQSTTGTNSPIVNESSNVTIKYGGKENDK